MKYPLPDAIILPAGQISEEFLRLDITSMHQALNWVHALPYGRNKDRADYRLVLQEKRGTCSTKHALLVALAGEQKIQLVLKFVVIKLDATIDPRVTPFLDKLEIDYLPEAHCIVSYNDIDFDLTFPHLTPFPNTDNVLAHYVIEPEDIGEKKLNMHKQYLKGWIQDKTNLSFEKLWATREEWIHYLSANN
jgi:hypothetical protein